MSEPALEQRFRTFYCVHPEALKARLEVEFAGFSLAFAQDPKRAISWKLGWGEADFRTEPGDVVSPFNPPEWETQNYP